MISRRDSITSGDAISPRPQRLLGRHDHSGQATTAARQPQRLSNHSGYLATWLRGYGRSGFDLVTKDNFGDKTAYEVAPPFAHGY